jgi:hypothetical protein
VRLNLQLQVFRPVVGADAVFVVDFLERLEGALVNVFPHKAMNLMKLSAPTHP